MDRDQPVDGAFPVVASAVETTALPGDRNSVLLCSCAFNASE